MVGNSDPAHAAGSAKIPPASPTVSKNSWMPTPAPSVRETAELTFSEAPAIVTLPGVPHATNDFDEIGPPPETPDPEGVQEDVGIAMDLDAADVKSESLRNGGYSRRQATRLAPNPEDPDTIQMSKRGGHTDNGTNGQNGVEENHGAGVPYDRAASGGSDGVTRIGSGGKRLCTRSSIYQRRRRLEVRMIRWTCVLQHQTSRRTSHWILRRWTKRRSARAQGT